MRIVSLIASATEIVHALGLGECLVGRSHECDYPESVHHLPVCTAPSFAITGSSAEIDRRVKERLTDGLSVYEVDSALLERLQPTHIITQTQCKVCAVSLDDVERALGRAVAGNPAVVSLQPGSLAEIWTDILRVADACGVPARGRLLVASLQRKMDRIALRAQKSPTCPRVACIEWIDPLMSAGNWVPELVQMANAENLFGQAGLHSPWMSWEDLRASCPDVVVAMPCGFDLERTLAEMSTLEKLPGWNGLPAVRAGRVFATDGNQFFNRPGPRVVESLEILAELLHPDVFEARQTLLYSTYLRPKEGVL